MSRSGYTDQCDDNWALIKWRGRVASATRGRRGQRLLKDLLAALDAMPEKRLVADSLVTTDGEFCTLGALGHARGIPIASLDPDDTIAVANAFDVAEPLIKEIVFENDQDFVRYYDSETPEQRWTRMRAWVAGQIKSEPPK